MLISKEYGPPLGHRSFGRKGGYLLESGNNRMAKLITNISAAITAASLPVGAGRSEFVRIISSPLCIHFITSIRSLKEIHQLVSVVGGCHPLGRITDLVVWAEPQLFQAAIGQIFDVLINVVGI